MKSQQAHSILPILPEWQQNNEGERYQNDARDCLKKSDQNIPTGERKRKDGTQTEKAQKTKKHRVHNENFGWV